MSTCANRLDLKANGLVEIEHIATSPRG